METWRELIKAQPGRISAYRYLGTAYVRQDRLSEAAALYREGLASNPDHAGLLLLQAELYQTRSDMDRALEVYERLLELQPESDVVRNNLAVLLMDHYPTEDNLRRAQQLTARLADSDNPVFLDTVGWLQYRLGNYPQALVLLQDAVRRGGTAPIYRYHLGMAYLKSEMHDEAREQLELALADESRFEGREEAESALEQL